VQSLLELPLSIGQALFSEKGEPVKDPLLRGIQLTKRVASGLRPASTQEQEKGRSKEAPPSPWKKAFHSLASVLGLKVQRFKVQGSAFRV